MKRTSFNLSKHYSTVGTRYDRLYEQLFGQNRREVMRFLSDTVIGGSAELVTIADIGGGTGLTIEALKALQPSERRFVLVEPYEKMANLAMNRKGPPDEIIYATAEDFAKERNQYDKYDVLICQEMIHHVNEIDHFFRGCHHLLKPSGKIIIITRPLEVEFPFGAHTHRHWKESYSMPPAEIPKVLKESGFAVEVTERSFPVSIDKRSWLECVGPNPLFSTLAMLSPEEYEEDLVELKSLPRQLHFHDHMIFILGKKV